MADLAAAMTRLAQAVDRVEAAASGQVARSGAARQRAADQLAAARAEFAELTQRTEGVSDRLDGAIERLKSVLEG